MDNASQQATVEAVRFTVFACPPLREHSGICLADAVHHRMAAALAGSGTCRDEALVLGRDGAATDHRHAHWVPLTDATGVVTDLLVWVPARLTAAEMATILTASMQPLVVPAERGGTQDGVEVRLLPHSAGETLMVAPRLCGPAAAWRTRTPYLPARHRKPRQPVGAFLADDVTRALVHHGYPAPVAVTASQVADGLLDDWAAGFRRYRLRERPTQQRVGCGLRVMFDRPVTGPLLLGRLSHFGFGVFLPE